MNAGKDIARLLNAREERAYFQGFLMSCSGTDFVVQVSLNIPGLPKSVSGDSKAIFSACRFLLGRLGYVPSASVQLRNHAGLACLMSFRGDAIRAKKTAISVEEGADWGRVFDIDVLTAGGVLSGNDFGRAQRKCFLCAESAKVCARAGTHDMDKLREKALRLLVLARLRQ
ncbi:MAG: citrate lyase holo-[acyl-carrier protein] synthase [Synergistaceae bacterium]|jgi:holo-ACP synthase|nr:citrate lyase holo-[acyl-carrier protein] synthase [Synergistaceae bacterium]